MLRNKRYFMLLAILLAAGLACNLSRSGDTQPSTSGQGQEPAVTEQAPGGGISLFGSPTEVPSKPIGLRQGLSSLDSYRLTIRMVNNGPSALDKSESTFTIESGSDGESSHITNHSVSSSEESPEAETDESDEYFVGNRQCSVPKDSEVDTSDMDPMIREVFDAWYGMLDLVPTVNEPVFVSAEEMNGITANHFKFTVKGLGKDTGSEVVSSDGEYWLAQDGQYIVKYVVQIETRNGPAADANTKTVHSEFLIDVKDINQNIVIEMPAACQK